MKEIDEIIQPLGEGVYTDLLDFNDMQSIPLDKKKELKITKEDQEYFAGTKKSLFNRKFSKVNLMSSFKNLTSNLSKSLQNFVGA